MTSIKVHLYTYRVNRKGTYPLVFQILHRRKKRVIYSPYHLYKECFDEKHGRVINYRKKKVSNANEINDYIRSMMYELEAVVKLLEKQKKDYSASDIVISYKLHHNNSPVLVYMRKLMVQLREEKRIGTLTAYQSTFNRVVRFTGGKEDLCFGDITIQWLNLFIGSLKHAGLKGNTINFYYRMLRAIYNRACNDGLLGTEYDSPFRKVSFGSVKTVKHVIDGESIKQIIHARIECNQQLEMARDLFLFSFYSCGMSFVDMTCLEYKDIINDVIYYKRRRTGQPLRVTILPQMEEIIEKYRNGGPYVLPILNTGSKSLYTQYRNELRKFNNHLKQLSSLLNLERPLTSYVARYSWVALARKSNIPVL
jgi:site-specific recombinase XerD